MPIVVGLDWGGVGCRLISNRLKEKVQHTGSDLRSRREYLILVTDVLFGVYFGLLLKPHFVVHRTEKEMNRRKDMLANLRSKVNQMASMLNMYSFANRDSLLGPEIKPADAMNRASGLDNSGIVGLQRQIMKGKLL